MLASASRDQSIESLADLADGCALINVLECLTGKRLDRCHADPQTQPQQIENIRRILQFLRDESVELENEIGEK